MIHTSSCVAVSTIHVEQIVIHAAKGLNKKHGASQKASDLLSVNHVTVLDILKNVNMILKWMPKVYLWISMEIMKVEVFAKIVVITLKESTVTNASLDFTVPMENCLMKLMFVNHVNVITSMQLGTVQKALVSVSVDQNSHHQIVTAAVLVIMAILTANHVNAI